MGGPSASAGVGRPSATLAASDAAAATNERRSRGMLQVYLWGFRPQPHPMNHRARRQTFLSLGLAVIALRAVSAQSAPAISEARIRADMAVLASDSFAGRKPGTLGERLTTAFIIGRLTAAGVAPANGGAWLQPLALEVRRMRSARLTVRAADASVM